MIFSVNMRRTRAGRWFMLLLMTAMLIVLPSGCGERANMLRDGYYTAEATEFDEHGWKEYIAIYVSGGKIVTADYNAKNASGFIKSWDMEYMRTMDAVCGTYPNEYTRLYAEDLMGKQEAASVDAITGATHSYHTFKQLAHAVIEQARLGDKSVCFVALEH